MSYPVTFLRRYPVKSMGGEALDMVELDQRGLLGDRWFAVEDSEGHFASGKNTRRFRRRDAVFDYAADTTADGQVGVTRDQQRWVAGDPALDRRLSDEMGTEVSVTPETRVPHQDDGSVSIISTATLRWCAERWGGSRDARRLRVNIVVDADEPFVEETWIGHQLHIGSAGLLGTQQIARCRMIDIAQDGVTPGVKWLKPLNDERGLNLAIYADVVLPGTLSIGDALHVG